MNERWTKKDYEYLEENWGVVSIPTIAKNLKRSVNAVKIKAQKKQLGSVLGSGDYISLNQLIMAVTGNKQSHTYHLTSWVEKRGLPIHKKRVDKCSFRVVYIDEFWEWAEKNRSFLDFSKMEPLVFGEEPEWVAEQRKKDFEAFSLQRKDVWSPAEDSRLKLLVKQQKYGYAELSEMLRRSVGAIQRRCRDLNIKDSPIKADNHGKEVQWTDEMYEILASGIRNGWSYTAIGKAVGKSEKAVRGKVYTVYLTENADKVREMMSGGKWGHGAPEPTVRQAKTLSGYRVACNRGIASLVNVLRYRMNELGYGTYWQREMCMNWDDYKGCKAGCENCDECTEFLRIKVQYCARCGAEFLERTQNRFCPRCRAARKKKAQMHWARENKRR